MKNKILTGAMSLIICFAGCNDDDSNRWYDSMPDGDLFHTGTYLRFFYVDEESNDLINLEDLSTFPVSSLEQLDSQPVIEMDEYYEKYNNFKGYNNDLNHVSYNEYKGLHEFFTYAFGDSRQSSYTFYVYHNGVADKMDVTFQYQNKKVDDRGRFYASNNTSWSVNGVEVYNINKPNN